MLSPYLDGRLERLEKKCSELSFDGAEPKSFNDAKLVAVVGTRKPTNYGSLITVEVVEALSKAGVVIVSGLALGIDSLAHSACLKAKGRTISVLPSGIANIYPATNRPVAKNILKSNGMLISEYDTKHQPRKVEFLERNRIIAALSDAVFIPEAAANSGSLNTANHAIKMNIPIFALPGNTTNPMSVGTNHLIKNGANLITSADDILDYLGILKSGAQATLDLTGDTEAETLILQKIALGIQNSSELIAATKLTVVEFQTALSMLEIQGRVSSDGSDNWHL